MKSPYSDTEPVASLVSERYTDEREALVADPIIKSMAAELMLGVLTHKVDFVHQGWILPNSQGGSPSMSMMLACNQRYHALDGTRSVSIGGVAHAIWSLVLPGLEGKDLWA